MNPALLFFVGLFFVPLASVSNVFLLIGTTFGLPAVPTVGAMVAEGGAEGGKCTERRTRVGCAVAQRQLNV